MAKRAIGAGAAFWLGACAAALAQGSAATGKAMPDSDMAPASGNTGAANNGVGQEGSLTRNDGSHSSVVGGAAAAARMPTAPKPSNGSNGDPQVEKDPNQGGDKQH